MLVKQSVKYFLKTSFEFKNSSWALRFTKLNLSNLLACFSCAGSLSCLKSWRFGLFESIWAGKAIFWAQSVRIWIKSNLCNERAVNLNSKITKFISHYTKISIQLQEVNWYIKKKLEQKKLKAAVLILGIWIFWSKSIILTKKTRKHKKSCNSDCQMWIYE